jgi:hypothetical protein
MGSVDSRTAASALLGRRDDRTPTRAVTAVVAVLLLVTVCGGPGATVAAEGGPAVGTVVSTNDHLDYAVIRFDPANVTPISDFDGFAINGIGTDPGFSQPACTQGGATGYGCGRFTVPGVKPATFVADMPSWQPGDDGRRSLLTACWSA